jgi:hypothetical protein
VSNESNSKLAALRFDDYSCADIARLRKTNSAVDSLFFTWARGFISGWNASAEKGILKVDPAALRPDDQLKFIRTFCDANPSKLFVVVLALENHSFDQMLGCMKELYPELEGVTSTQPNQNADHDGTVYVQAPTEERQMQFDPHHEVSHVRDLVDIRSLIATPVISER